VKTLTFRNVLPTIRINPKGDVTVSLCARTHLSLSEGDEVCFRQEGDSWYICKGSGNRLILKKEKKSIPGNEMLRFYNRSFVYEISNAMSIYNPFVLKVGKVKIINNTQMYKLELSTKLVRAFS